MKDTAFYKMFIELLQDTYDAENQIVKALPEMARAASNPDLKKGFTEHLAETKEQVSRLERVFSLLGEKAKSKKCEAITGLIAEGKEIINNTEVPAVVKDCFLVIAAQKIEHYKIAGYGSILTLVDHLSDASQGDIDFETITDLLEDSLDEEKNADATLTKVAEGTWLKDGINEIIEEKFKART